MAIVFVKAAYWSPVLNRADGNAPYAIKFITIQPTHWHETSLPSSYWNHFEPRNRMGNSACVSNTKKILNSVSLLWMCLSWSIHLYIEAAQPICKTCVFNVPMNNSVEGWKGLIVKRKKRSIWKTSSNLKPSLSKEESKIKYKIARITFINVFIPLFNSFETTSRMLSVKLKRMRLWWLQKLRMQNVSC